MPRKHGVFLGRFQPFHTGHQSIIDHIIADGLEPVILAGSAQESCNVKNPYSVEDRTSMINLVYPNIKVISIEDRNCWDEWYSLLKSTLQEQISEDFDEITIYLHEKLEDLQNFTVRGVDYLDESYCKMYEIDGLHTTSLPISDIPIRAKLIREDLEANKHYLHPSVYNYIKDNK